MVIYRNYAKTALFSFMPVAEIEPFHVQSYYNDLSKTKSYSVMTSINKQFKRFFQYLADTRQIEYNPTRAVVIPNSVKEKHKTNKSNLPKTYSKDEREILYKAAFEAHPIYGCIIYLMFMTGIRSGEALGLRKYCIDFTKMQIKIMSTCSKVREFDYNGKVIGSEFQNDTTKSRESTRTIYFDAEIAMVLKNAMALQVRQGKQNELYLNDEDLLFTTSSGRPIESRNLRRFWERLCTRLGIAYRSPHKSRHTFISELDDMGVDRSILQQIVGHKVDSIITEKHYIHKEQKRSKRKCSRQ